jgi:hypothetical protein
MPIPVEYPGKCFILKRDTHDRIFRAIAELTPFDKNVKEMGLLYSDPNNIPT